MEEPDLNQTTEYPDVLFMSDLLPCRSPDEVFRYLELSEKGCPYCTIKNVLHIFICDPFLSNAIGYNILTDRIELCKPMFWRSCSGPLRDTDFNYILLHLEEKYHLNNEQKIRKAMLLAADKNRFHPVQEYLNSLNWDGTERIQSVLNHFLGAEINTYTYEVMRLFLLGAITRVFSPGCKFEYILCLIGGQGAGKSTFFRFLAVKDDWFTDDLSQLSDENSSRRLQGHWIVELSEMLPMLRSKNSEEYKAFLSRQKDTIRKPYEIEPEDHPRQCIFGGTSNKLDFLPLDRSGNRRFLPVMVHPELAKVHILEDEASSRAYIDQLWAEAMYLYRTHSIPLKLSPALEESLPEIQKRFTQEDTNVGIIQSFLDSYPKDIVCSKLLYHEALGYESKPSKQEIMEINDIMNHSITDWTYYENPRSFKDYGKQRGWIRKSKKSET